MFVKILHLVLTSKRQADFEGLKSRNKKAAICSNLEKSKCFDKCIYLNYWNKGPISSDLWKVVEKFVQNSTTNLFVYMVFVDSLNELNFFKMSHFNAEIKHYEEDNIQTQSVDKNILKLSISNSSIKSSEHEKTGEKSKGYEFLRKVMKWPKSKNHSNVTMDEIFIRDICYDEKDAKIIKKISPVPPTYKNSTNHYLDYSAAQALEEIIELMQRIQDNEEHIKNIIVKYISDKSVQKELVKALACHGKLLLESEKRALNLTSKTWLQQAEIYKEQQSALQDTLQAVVHQNREMQQENENLVKKNERLYIKIVLMQEAGTAVNHRPSTVTSMRVIEDLNRNNDKLRVKLNLFISQIEELEETLKKVQNKNDFLQKQLNSSNFLVQNHKGMLQKSKTDYEIEVAKIYNELQASTLQIKDAFEAGDYLIKDLENIKPEINDTINLDTFKKSEKSLVDLVYLSRSCINELFRNVANMKNDSFKHSREKEKLETEIERLNALVLDLTSKQENLRFLSLAHEKCDNIFNSWKEKNEKLEEVIKKNEGVIHSKESEISMKEREIKDLKEKIEKDNKDIKENLDAINQINVKYQNVQRLNESLRAQIDGMSIILSATGSGEIAKELTNSQEKLLKLEHAYFSLLSQRNILVEELKVRTAAMDKLVKHQKDFNEQFDVIESEKNILKRENFKLKEQLDAEKATVSVLQLERVHHLEEKNLLTVFCEHLKSDIIKVDELEQALSTINNRAGKLALIAEHNKQIGKKLQSEVAEKDLAISKLQNNLQLLNNLQVESSKEKVALCKELNEVFMLKNELDGKLAREVEKTVLLVETKQDHVHKDNSKYEQLQILYKKEQERVKRLEIELKTLINENVKLLGSQKANEEKVVYLENEKLGLLSAFMKLKETSTLLQNQNQKMKMEFKNVNDIFVTKYSKLKKKLISYKENNNFLKSVNEENVQLKQTISELKIENEGTTSSIKELENVLISARNDNGILKATIDAKNQNLKELSTENKSLKSTVDSLRDSCSQLQTDVYKLALSQEKYENLLREKQELEKFVEEMSEKDEEIILLQEQVRDFEKENLKLKDSVNSLNLEKECILKNSSRIESRLNQVNINYEDTLKNITALKKENSELSEKLERNELEASDKCVNYQQIIEDLKNEHSHINQTMELDMLEWKTKYQDAMNEYQLELNAKTKLQKSLRHVAFKLMKAAQMLITEKVTRLNLQSQLQKQEEEYNKLKEEYDLLVEELTDKVQNIQYLTSLADDVATEKEDIMKILEEAESRCSKVEEQMANIVLETGSECHDECLLQKLVSKENELGVLQDELIMNREEVARLQKALTSLETDYARLEFNKCGSILQIHEVKSKIQSQIDINNERKYAIDKALVKMKDEGVISEIAYDSLVKIIHAETPSDEKLLDITELSPEETTSINTF